MFLFWDLKNNSSELLGDDGEFWSYSEDHVVIDQGGPDEEAYTWYKLCKVSNVHPINEPSRFEVYDPRLNEWVNLQSTNLKTYREIYKLAGAECYD